MELNIREAARYLGAGEDPPEELRRTIEETAAELTAKVRPRGLFRVFSLEHEAEGIRLAEADILLKGKTAGTMLSQCPQAAALACTLGADYERIYRRTEVRDMARAVVLDACASAWVEAGCDELEREIAARFPGRYLTDRFSPGYGDLSLELQKPLCAALNVSRRLGVQVTEHFLLNPSKTVTAFIGLSDRPQEAKIRGCAFCSLRERCALRQGGTRCGL